MVEVKLSKKKTAHGITYFVLGRGNKSEFVDAVRADAPRDPVTEEDVIWGHSYLDGGQYGIGRVFLGKRNKKSDPTTYVLPKKLRGRTIQK